MKRVAVFAGLVAISLAGCQSIYGVSEPVRPMAAQQPASGIEGSWIDKNGIVSTFSNGTFETRTTDTNSVLATGTYTQQTPSLVQISLHSRLRNTDSTVNCALAGTNQLNCTSSTGAQFSLTRSNAPLAPSPAPAG